MRRARNVNDGLIRHNFLPTFFMGTYLIQVALDDPMVKLGNQVSQLRKNSGLAEDYFPDSL